MYYLLMLMICVTSNITIVRVDHIELNTFFKQIQSNYDVVSRSVFLDDQDISINDYFKTFNAKLLKVDDTGPITKHNAYEAAHLLNVVLTCEYHDFMYSFVRLVDIRFEDCQQLIGQPYAREEKKSDDVRACFDSNYKTLFNPILKIMSSMVKTLIGLLQNTKNVVAKTYDFLKIIVSWHALIFRDVTYKLLKEKKVDWLREKLRSIKIINYQIKSQLETFGIAHCRRPKNYEEFKQFINNTMKLKINNAVSDKENSDCEKKVKPDEVDENKTSNLQKSNSFQRSEKKKWYTSTSKSKEKIDVAIEKEAEKLQLIMSNSFQRLEKIKWCIFCPGYFEILLKQINIVSNNETIAINNNLVNAKTFYKTNIKKSSDLPTILEFEIRLLQNIMKNIYGFAINIIQSIIENKRITDKSKACNENLRLVMDKYINKFKDDGQPSYLINSMIVLNKDFWLVCNKMKSAKENSQTIRKYIMHWYNLQPTVFLTSRTLNLDTLLSPLKNILICAKLHPAISNFYMEKIRFYDSNITTYVTDHKHIYTNYREMYNIPIQVTTPSTGFCKDIESSLRTLYLMKSQIDELTAFVATISRKLPELVENDPFKTFKSTFNNFECKLFDLISNYSNNFDDKQFYKILLLAVYNHKYVELFDYDVLRTLSTHRIKYLYNFQYEITNLLNVQYQYYCSFESSITSITSHSLSLPADESWKENENAESKFGYEDESMLNAITDSSVHEELEKIRQFENFFKYFSDYASQIIDEESLSEEFNLYWNSSERSIDEVHAIYMGHPFDLQKGHDFQLFVVRWLLAVPYTRIWDILNDMIGFRSKIEATHLRSIEKCLARFTLRLPLYVSSAVSYDLQRFVNVARSYDGHDITELVSYQKVITKELEFIGVVLDSIPHMKGIISGRVRSMCKKIESLVSIYSHFHEAVETEAQKMNIIENNLLLLMDV